MKEIAQDLAHNRSHAGAGTIVKNFVASGAFFAFLVNLLMPFAMIAAFMGLVKFEVATIGHPVLMFGAVLLTLVVIGFFISRLLGPLDWWYYVTKHQYHLRFVDKSRRDLLDTIEVAFLCECKLQPFSEPFSRVMQATEETVQLLEQKQNVLLDTSYFAEAYDRFTQMLLFVYANQSVISEELFLKYVVNLESLAGRVEKEVSTMAEVARRTDDIVADQLKKAQMIEASLVAQRQRELDDMALSMMPLGR